MAKSIYGVHPGVTMVQTAIAKLPKKTGRSLDQWIALIGKSGPKSETARCDWLKKTHKLGTNYAGWLAEHAEGKACPCKTIVPLYRRHVFAQIKPTTRTRIDLGLALGNAKAPQRLIDTGGFKKKDRITHRIEITAPGDIDGEMTRWLKNAYELDA